MTDLKHTPEPWTIPNAKAAAIAHALRDDGPNYVLGAAFRCAFIYGDGRPYPIHFWAFLKNGLVEPYNGKAHRLTPLGREVRDILASAKRRRDAQKETAQ